MPVDVVVSNLISYALQMVCICALVSAADKPWKEAEECSGR
jgi:hypothetical protein